MTEPILSLVRSTGDEAMQQQLLDAINADGRIYITQGMHAGRKTIWFQVGQFDCTRENVMLAAVVTKEIRQAIK